MYNSPVTEVAKPYFSVAELPSAEQWVDPVLVLLDAGRPVSFHLLDAISFHGLDSIGGVILGFRLMQRAFAWFSPGVPAERRSLSLFTSFPGFGARDTFELVTRMVSEDRYQVDPDFEDLRAPEGVSGRFYFRFAMAGRSLILAPPAGVPDADFVRLGRASKAAKPADRDYSAIMAEWKNARFRLARLLLSLDCEKALRILPQ